MKRAEKQITDLSKRPRISRFRPVQFVGRAANAVLLAILYFTIIGVCALVWRIGVVLRLIFLGKSAGQTYLLKKPYRLTTPEYASRQF